MAITINGSGTITGISTGGLPDGIVDADMLAGNAVTSAKILDGTIASGDLASGVGGKVLQFLSGVTGGSTLATTSTTFADIPAMTFTIQPAASSNKICMVWTNHVYCAAIPSNNWKGVLLKILRGSTAISQADVYGDAIYHTDATSRFMVTTTRVFTDSPNTTSSTTYKLQAASKYSGGQLYVNSHSYGSGGSWMAMEIAG